MKMKWLNTVLWVICIILAGLMIWLAFGTGHRLLQHDELYGYAFEADTVDNEQYHETGVIRAKSEGEARNKLARWLHVDVYETWFIDVHELSFVGGDKAVIEFDSIADE